MPTLLAGGLNPDNVGDAITIARPTGVDVASGVETEPGIKSKELVTRFVNASRRAFENPQ
jgi:phosphoribosylanthranilate isomerase